jgi:hypothetical protein
MKTLPRGTVLPDKTAFAIQFSAGTMIIALLGGCAYFDSLNPTPDDRIQLTRSDGEIRLGRREVRDFTCTGDLILHCRDWGPTTLACSCALP